MESGKKEFIKSRRTQDVSIWKTQAIEMDRGLQLSTIPNKRVGHTSCGLHGGKYECLRQYQPIKFWRDRNFDDKADYIGEVHKDLIFVNIHRASIRGSIKVDRYSAGCIVICRPRPIRRFYGVGTQTNRIPRISNVYTNNHWGITMELTALFEQVLGHSPFIGFLLYHIGNSGKI